MKIKVNDQDLFELSPTQCKVICNDIHEDEFDADMKRRLQYILTHKYERCFERLKAEWCSSQVGQQSKLERNGVKSIPTNPHELAELIFTQPNYECRKTREEKAKLNPRMDISPNA
jgi:hypothetical protein